MRLVYVWAGLAAVVAPGCWAVVELSCDCRLWHLRHVSTSLHCSREQIGASGVKCQKDNVLDIPHGFQYVPGFGLLKLYSLMRKWPAAKKACEEEGAQLAVPRDSVAYDGIKQILGSAYAAGGVSWAYIGITDQLTEGAWVGVDGHPVSHLPWKPGEPSNYGNNEDCADVNSDGVLNDTPCSNTAPYICERRLSVAIPDGYKWEADAGRFYRVHPEKHVHAEAARVCRSENAGLAVADTWRRGEVLLKKVFGGGPNLYQQYHVGFTDEATEGDFVTETGRHLRDMEFQAWEDKQPNNNDKGKPENCVALSEAGYSDVRCDLALPFLCEILPV